MSLQFTLCPLLACRGRLRNSGANCSTIGLCCATITWQQIFENALQVTVVLVLPLVTIECRVLGRSCSETVTADNGKSRRFKPMVDELRVADIFSVALLHE